MRTKRLITENDAKKFFETSINTMDDAIGKGIFNTKTKQIKFDFNAVLLLRFNDVLAETTYPIENKDFDPYFKDILVNTISNEDINTTNYQYIRTVDEVSYNFDIKFTTLDSNNLELFLVCYEKLVETENQVKLFAEVIGSGHSMFLGSTWWKDLDRFSDKFFMTDIGAEILGVPVRDDRTYITQDFLDVREKAKIVSDLYEQSIVDETNSFQKVLDNETDYLGSRTPAVTAEDEIVWVETYGKCMLRYPDGSPRFIVVLDVYMSDIYEEKTQLELLTNLIDEGLINSDVGVWYHQRHYLEGKYYFTKSYQNLMSNNRKYQDDTITDILNEQISLMEKDNQGYEEYLIQFRKTHNMIYTHGLDKYHLVIPNYKDDNTFQWIEVRGTVIERDQDGNVNLFVGVNVDVTESFLRNRELEQLKLQNEKLQMAERLAISTRNLIVWTKEAEVGQIPTTVIANEQFSKQLGIERDENGEVKIADFYLTLDDSPEAQIINKEIVNKAKALFRQEVQKLTKILVKHKNIKTGKIIYLEHSAEISYDNTSSDKVLMGGVMLDVTETVLYQNQIKYLANYDTLSDTFNRNYFELFTKNDLPESYTITIFDLDGLKLTNDAFGHIKGDSVIKKLAEFLKEVYSQNAIVSRIGGDEFAVISLNNGIDTSEKDFELLDRKIDEFNQKSILEMNVSKGSKSVIRNNITYEKAFVDAENIMYRSKLNNRISRKSKVLESILETLNAKTTETKEHSDRLGALAIKIMKGLGYSRKSEIDDISLLARVHDIGKVTINDQILKKPSALEDHEFEEVKKHSEAGYKIIRNITDSDDVCHGVLYHHERWDGRGYPHGLKGDDIPLYARVIAVVDSYDAMTNDRVYRDHLTHQEAIDEIKSCSGTQFDPEIVEAFLKYCFD